MSETSGENQERNREIAENESARQVTGDIRVSAWAIAIAVELPNHHFTSSSLPLLDPRKPELR